MSQKLNTYFRGLANLSGNNSSFQLLDLPESFFLDLKILDNYQLSRGFKVLENIIEGEGAIDLIGDGEDKRLESQLESILRNDQIIFQEKGSKDLYVGWPMVKGKFKDETVVQCPLIFFPMALERKEEGWSLHRRENVNITLNKTFLLRYAYHNQVELDDNLIELVLNDFESDSTLFRSQLYEILKKSTLEIEFNQENFINDLLAFEARGVQRTESTGELKLIPNAILGIFPQSGAYLVSDYSKLLKDTPNLSIPDFLDNWITTEDQQGSQLPIKEETIFTPFSLDSSQERALHLIRSRKSLLVQGPPGTGKTQMICNMISDFIARGKNVLLVSQKRTALDVAYQRLKTRGLHDFIGLVHDFKSDRRMIYSRIIKQIEKVDEYRQKNNALDAEQLEKLFINASRIIDDINDELTEYKQALFDESECGKSVKTLYLISNRADPFIELNQVYRSYDFKKIAHFLPVLTGYMEYYRKFEMNAHFWAQGPSFARFGPDELSRIQAIIDEVYVFGSSLKKESHAFTKNEIDFETALFFLANKDSLDQLAANLKNETTYHYYIHMVDYSPEEDPAWLSNMERTLLQCFKGSGPEISLPSADLGRFQEALEHAIRARKGLLSWLRWRIFSEDKIFITRVLVANELKSNKNGFETLLKMIDNRLNFEHFVSEIRDVSWLKDFPDSFRVIDIQNWFFYQKLALKSYHLRQIVRSLPNYILAKNETREKYIDTIHQLISLVEQIPKKLKKWGKYVSESQVRMLLLDKVGKKDVIAQLHHDFEALIRYHTYRDSFDPEDQKMIEGFVEMETQDQGQVEDIFMNSICLAWIDHIEQKYPVLRSGATNRLSELSRELQQYVDEKMRVSQDILLLNTRKRTYASQEYEGTDSHATYSELSTLLTDEFYKWPIRSLISQYREDIFSLLPCWMTTPESASAIFPLQPVFDLVIFDEASQCLPERSIPAMFRGDTVVVVGDEQQLPPNQLFNLSENALEGKKSDSLLQLVKGHFDEVRLLHHYRSRSVTLFDFSNHHFYQSKIKSIPGFKETNSLKPPIQYVLVEGHEIKRSNAAEASEVLKIISNELKKNRKSIGIVVPTIEQQQLIGDLLDDLVKKEKFKIPESFFIKTVENVQGDESDMIILSFVLDDKLLSGALFETGHMINVAVSRAREKMVVVTSIHPDQLKKGQSPGVDLLGQFLHFASNVSSGNVKKLESNNRDHQPEWLLKKYLLNQRPDRELMIADDFAFSDGVIKKGTQYYGTIISDDQLLEEGPKETFCHKYNQLRERKWPFIQFNTREFWSDREISFEKLKKFTQRETN